MSWARRVARISTGKRQGGRDCVSKAQSQKKKDSLSGILGTQSIVIIEARTMD